MPEERCPPGMCWGNDGDWVTISTEPVDGSKLELLNDDNRTKLVMDGQEGVAAAFVAVKKVIGQPAVDWRHLVSMDKIGTIYRTPHN